MWVQSLGWEDPLEKGMVTHSSILGWRIPWTEEPGRLQSIGHHCSDLACTHVLLVNHDVHYVTSHNWRVPCKANLFDKFC